MLKKPTIVSVVVDYVQSNHGSKLGMDGGHSSVQSDDKSAFFRERLQNAYTDE